jgi:hypothetical protein
MSETKPEDPVLARANAEAEAEAKALAEARAEGKLETVDIKIAGEGDCLVMITPERGVRMTREQIANIPHHFGVKTPDDLLILNHLQWHNADFSARVDILKRANQPLHLARKNDVFDVLNDNTKAFIEAWQKLVNSGECWFTFGDIGKAAATMLNKGVLMAAHEDKQDFYGSSVPGRSSVVQGHEQSYAYVAAIMGTRYADWLATIE